MFKILENIVSKKATQKGDILVRIQKKKTNLLYQKFYLKCLTFTLAITDNNTFPNGLN